MKDYSISIIMHRSKHSVPWPIPYVTFYIISNQSEIINPSISYLYEFCDLNHSYKSLEIKTNSTSYLRPLGHNRTWLSRSCRVLYPSIYIYHNGFFRAFYRISYIIYIIYEITTRHILRLRCKWKYLYLLGVGLYPLAKKWWVNST